MKGRATSVNTGTFVVLACLATTQALAGMSEAKRAALVQGVDEAVQKIALNSAQTNDSGGLGWGEGYILQAITAMYAGTGDMKWLATAQQHIDAALCFLTDHDDDGFLSWHTNTYSGEPTLMKAHPAEGNRGSGAISVEETITKSAPWRARTLNHRFRVIFLSRSRFCVVDEDTEMPALLSPHSQPGLHWLPIQAYESGATVWRARGLHFEITGQPEPGDSFAITPTTPRKYDYVAHDGMMTYPIAQFVRLVKQDAQLQQRFGEAAEGYLALLERHFFAKWDSKRWIEDGERGVYWESQDPEHPQRYASLPMNQYTAFGRTVIELYRATKKPEYLDRATKMARTVKSLLKEEDGAYLWSYMEPVAEWDTREKPKYYENTNYADLDVSFMIDAFEAGVVFDREDMQKLTNTFIEVMWNGSMEEPTVAGRVDGTNGTSDRVAEFVRLSQFDPRVWRICYLVNERAQQAGHGNIKREALLLACERYAE